MDNAVEQAIVAAVENEPLPGAWECGWWIWPTAIRWVEMRYDPTAMDNIYRRAHGGAIYALIDEAFETASQDRRTIAVALNVNVSYVASPAPGTRLRAEAQRVSRMRKTAGFSITVTDEAGNAIATCQALAYRTGKPIPFL